MKFPLEMLYQLNRGKPIIEIEGIDTHHLEKTILLKNFAEALTFTNQVASIAEKEGHHPDIELGWGRVKIIIWTHKIDGLSESDFILAAKISAIGKPAA